MVEEDRRKYRNVEEVKSIHGRRQVKVRRRSMDVGLAGAIHQLSEWTLNKSRGGFSQNSPLRMEGAAASSENDPPSNRFLAFYQRHWPLTDAIEYNRLQSWVPSWRNPQIVSRRGVTMVKVLSEGSKANQILPLKPCLSSRHAELESAQLMRDHRPFCCLKSCARDGKQFYYSDIVCTFFVHLRTSQGICDFSPISP